MIGPCPAALDEEDLEVGTVDGDHESRYTATAAEVEDRAGDRHEGIDERAGVVNDEWDGTQTQHPKLLRELQSLDQRSIGAFRQGRPRTKYCAG